VRHFLTYFTALFLSLSSLHSQNFGAGTAFRDITPDPLLPVSGGVGVPQPAHILKGRLSVRVMAFSSNGEILVVVGIDNLGWPAWLGDQTRKYFPEIPPENMLIAATHTHSAPDAYGFPDENGKPSSDQEYLAFCIQQMAEAIKEALDNIRPAYLKIAVGEAEGKIAYNYYAPRLYDPRCGVIQALDASNDQVIGTLVNYAIHPEVLGPRQGILSPDLCGPLYDQIESRVGGVALFINGAQGGMVTADNRREGDREDQTWEECERIGRLLADEALRIVDTAKAQSQPILSIHSVQTTFPVTSPLMKQIMDATGLGDRNEDGYTVSTTLTMVDLGTSRILTIPGEALPNIGYYLKRKMGVPHPFLFGLTNDAYGYILTKEDYDSFERYSYITRTSLGEQTGEILTSTYEDLIKSHPRN